MYTSAGTVESCTGSASGSCGPTWPTAVRRAEWGERIVITVAGRPAAQLGPLEPLGPAPLTLDDLVARGLRPRSPPPRPAAPGPPVPVWAGARLDRLLREQRG